jgi:hypothetical protein
VKTPAVTIGWSPSQDPSDSELEPRPKRIVSSHANGGWESEDRVGRETLGPVSQACYYRAVPEPNIKFAGVPNNRAEHSWWL